jgi:hypothetical protein
VKTVLGSVKSHKSYDKEQSAVATGQNTVVDRVDTDMKEELMKAAN